METWGNVHEPTRRQSPLDIPETLQLVCSFLDRRTLLAASRVSKAWRACCHPFLWSSVDANAWTNPYLLEHWREYAHLIRHISLVDYESYSESVKSAGIQQPLLGEVSQYCHELMSVDASQIVIRHPPSPSSSPSLSSIDDSSPRIINDLTRVLLHNCGQLRSLSLSLQGRVPRDLVHALGYLHNLQELSLNNWIDFDEYSLQLILLEACPTLTSLSLSDNDFLPFDLESLVTVGCQPSTNIKSWSTAGSTPTAAGVATISAGPPASWAREDKNGQKRASDPAFMPAANLALSSAARSSPDVATFEREYPPQRRQQHPLCYYPSSHHHGRHTENNKVYLAGKYEDNQHLHLGSNFSPARPHHQHSPHGTFASQQTNSMADHHSPMKGTTQIRSLTIHRAAFRQGFLLNLLRLCPKLERLSLLESRGFFPTSTFTSRLARQCPRLHAFEFSGPSPTTSSQANRQADLSDAFFVSLLDRFPETTHLVVGGGGSGGGGVRVGDGSKVSSGAGTATGFSLGGWKQLLHISQQQQLVHVTIDGVRGVPSKSLVQLLESCSSLRHWSASGVVLNACDVGDPLHRPWACRRLRVFVMDIEIYMPVNGGGGGSIDQSHDQPENGEIECEEEVVRRHMYGQLALLTCLVHVGIGGGHGFRRLRNPHLNCGGASLTICDRYNNFVEEPGIDLSRRSGVVRLKGCWPFLEVMDVTRLATNPRWTLDEGDERWISDHFPRLRRIVVSTKSTTPVTSLVKYTQPPYPKQQQQQPMLRPQPILPWIRHNRPDISIDE